jgi:hypothetical protein
MKKHFKTVARWIIFLMLAAIISFAVNGCAPSKDLTIPQEPTIWIVSEIYEPKREQFNGMVGYKIVPVNPGSINARPTWKLDYKGKYHVGQRLDFAPLANSNAPGPR